MDIFIIILQLAGGVLGLHFGAEWLVSGSSRLALSFGVRPLIIGLTLVAFGTSAPELTVSMAGALSGSGDLSVGNVIGSNIANIGLVLGLTCLIRPLPVDVEVFKRDLPAMLAAAVLIAVLPFIGGGVEQGDGVVFMLTRWKGALLLCGLGGFLVLMFRAARGGNPEPDTEDAEHEKSKRGMQILLIILGLAVLLIGGKFFVDGAVTAATKMGVPKLVIGLTVLAIGTSLPELATSIAAMLKGESDIGLGNVVGSNIFNILMVLGAVALISPLALSGRVMTFDIPIMLGFSVAVGALAWHGKRLGRIDGAILLSAYGLYVSNLFMGWV
ncbi:calcium/sodium antiporter [Planctomycetota bacterium]|nr:calcium/sodium antiporter [Planctomycetota bacterium]